VRVPLLGVTQDATSNVYVPQSSSEWTTFNAANGWANPDHLYLFQEASGNIVDKIGSSNLTVAGAPTYQQSVTGWSTLALHFTEATNNQRATSTAITNINTTSCTVLAYIRTPTTPAAARAYLTLGTTTNTAKFTLTTTPRYRTDSVANTATDTATVPSTVQCHVLKVDRTNNVVKGYITAAAGILTPTFNSAMTGNQLSIGSVNNGTVATIGMDVLYCAIWVGSNAEKTDQDIKSLMMQLGNNFWSPSWTVAYTASLSESESVSESVSVVVSDVVGLSETEVTTEATAIAASDVVSISESEIISEATSPAVLAIVGMSESESITESLEGHIPYTTPLVDSLTVVEQIQVESGGGVDMSETLSTSEQLVAIENAIAAINEAEGSSELLAVVYNAVAEAVVDELNTLENILVGIPYSTSLSESVALSEALLVLAAIPARELLSTLVSKAYAGTLMPVQRMIGALVSLAYSSNLKERGL
jgi:hypothetical protein